MEEQILAGQQVVPSFPPAMIMMLLLMNTVWIKELAISTEY